MVERDWRGTGPGRVPTEGQGMEGRSGSSSGLVEYPRPAGPYEALGREIGELVDRKNKAYGDSFAKSGSFLRLLFPGCIRPEQYDDLLALVRVWDKMMRVATHRDALGEDPWQDIAGYALLMCAARRREEK